MRVLHVYRTYSTDQITGVGEAIRQIALATQDFGVEPRVFTLSTDPVPKRLDLPEGTLIRGRSWGAPASCDFGLRDALRCFAEQARWADIIHYQFPWPFADLLRLVAAARKPSVLTYHSDVVGKGILGRAYRPLSAYTLEAMRAVIATSPAYARTSPILCRYRDRPELQVVPLGISEASCRESLAEAGAWSVARDFGLVPGGYFLFVGALRPYKGLEYLLEAAERSGLPLAIAGDGERGARWLQQRASPPNVAWLGRVSDAAKFALIQACRAVVLPSHLRSEAFGLVLVEAAMCGKPMISCEIGTGTSYVNAHAETGLVVPPANAAALEDAMQRIAASDELAAGMGAAARQRYRTLFSGHRTGAEYARIYQHALGRSPDVTPAEG